MTTPVLQVIATGGTIASHLEGQEWISLPGAQLIEELGPLPATVQVRDVASGDSASLTPTAMAAVATAIDEAVAAGVDGVVVTHGTDTLELTAFACDLLLGGTPQVPVIFTGSMRPHSHPEPDGPENLRQALALAATPALRLHGVVAVLDGEVHRAAEICKIDATQVQAFVSIPGPPLGTVDGDQFSGPAPTPRSWSRPRDLEATVPLLTVYPGMAPAAIAAAADGADGLVLEVFGALNLPHYLWGVVYELGHGGLPIILAGRPYATGYRDEGLDFLGVVGSGGRSAQKARLALAAACSTGDVATNLPIYLGVQP